LNATYKLYEHPKKFGKPLTGKLKNSFRLRIGDYRLLYKINEEKMLVVILDVDHRSKIYD